MNMTRTEFYEKYGDVEVAFSSYYKFSFAFSAELPDGSLLSCEVGGNSEDIYRFDVVAGVRVRLLDLQPFYGLVKKDGETVDEFYDY